MGNQAKKHNKMELMEHKDIFVYLVILVTDVQKFADIYFFY